MRIAIVGFGLIGGSIARALRRAGTDRSSHDERFEIAAWSRTAGGPMEALAGGVIDRAPHALAETLDGAELVILAAPPLACLELLDALGGPLAGALHPEAVVTDVVSTKRAIVERADRRGLRFVGGHPMAGRETTGYRAADPELFVDRPWVICPGTIAGRSGIELVERLAVRCGARPIRLPAAAHDEAVAAISHVPLVVSAALVEALAHGRAWPTAAGLAAGGWRDMSRLATGDPTMGAGIVATNADEIAAGLAAVREVIDGWIAELGRPEPDVDALVVRFEAARERLGRR